MIFYIARRHIFSGQGFAAFMSYASMLGIAFGVAALIVILSVMNGFQEEIRTKILSMISHVEVLDVPEWRAAQKQIMSIPGIDDSAPFVVGQGLLSVQGKVHGLMIRGIDPQEEEKVIPLQSYLKAGSLEKLNKEEFGIILGTRLAANLDIQLGDRVTLITPQGQLTPAGMLPRIKMFRVMGLFESGMYEYDQNLAMIRLQDAQLLYRLENKITGLRVRLKDPLNAPNIKPLLQNKFPYSQVQDWRDLHGSYFRAVQTERKMMWIVLGLMIAVSAFNLVSSLMIRVHQKQGDIAILRTMGASSWQMMGIFMVQGLCLGGLGLCLGVAFGLVLVHYLTNILSMMEYFMGHKLLSADVYNIDYLPTQVLWSDLIQISGIVLCLALLATLYPSWKAARVAPAEALRYE
jgi:lipoprotein-releasing system permease protein